MGSKDKKDVIERAKENLRRMVDEMSKAHEVGKMCMEFVGGEQWDDEALEDRGKRITVTINKLANPVNIVVNKQAMERSRIKVRPFEDSDVDTAKVINGLVRHIQYSEKSDAGEAFSHGFFNQVVKGYGYWRIDTEYCDELDFNQEIVINKIEDADSVYLDPDGMFCLVVSFMRKELAEDKYGDKDFSANWDTEALDKPHEDDVMIVEYWEREDEDVPIVQIRTAEQIVVEQETVDIDQAIEMQTEPRAQYIPSEVKIIRKDEFEQYPGAEILKERTTTFSKVTQYILSGEVLEENEWAGKYIPIIGSFSRKYKTRNGDYFFMPLVYHSLDPQRLYNYDKSQYAEWMNMAPKPPYIGAEGQFAGHEDEWSASNVEHVPYLEYKPVEVGGQLAPPPQRTPPPMPSQAHMAAMQLESEEIKDTMGIFDANMGRQGNESSGRAIIARRQQGDIGTYHFTVSDNSAMRRTGIVLLDLIPRIYDTARTIRILGEDLADEVVKINQQYVDKDGKSVLYDLTAGKYDVVIETGPSSLTRRLDAAENLLEFARVVPNAGAVGADMIVQNLDFEKSDELALRLKASLPPGLLEKVDMMQETGGKGLSQHQQMMNQMQQQMQQMGAQAQQLAKENQMLKAQLQKNNLMSEQIKGRFNLQGKQIDAQAQIQKQRISTAGDIEQELIRRGGNIPMPPAVPPAGMRQMRQGM